MIPAASDPGTEFDRQVHNLLAAGYPAMAGMTEAELVRHVAPLRPLAVAGAAAAPASSSRVPFVLVVTRALVPAEMSVPALRLEAGTKAGFVDRLFRPGDLARFSAIKEIELPAGPAYLTFDIERGEEFRNIAPDGAMPTILGRGRTPITVDEGVALVTHRPELLEKNKCFSLAGSRCGDRRVPALWISQGAPKLGWCWAGNPHTWLGCASAGNRMGSAEL